MVRLNIPKHVQLVRQQWSVQLKRSAKQSSTFQLLKEQTKLGTTYYLSPALFKKRFETILRFVE
jgi:hypothetical protein